MIDKKQAQDKGINILENGDNKNQNKQELITKLKALLPNVINSDNQLDIKALNDVIDLANTTSNNQGYELTFAGKGIARALADSNTGYELKAEKRQSKDFASTKNVVIRGDNLEVLKILYQNYHNKIKMIYIDPPYNTKSENFVYKDNFKKSDEELIEKFGLNEETQDFLQNVYGTRSHSGWLSFIYPRLKLARELLTDDGVIFISIDDNEQANLKIICDEIFGEENFVAEIVWRKKYGGGKGSNHFVDLHEYILCYSKNKSLLSNFNIERTEKQKNIFTLKDEYKKQRGKYYIRPLKSGLATRKTLIYPIKCPDNTIIETQWICAKNTFENLLKNGRIVFKKLRSGKYNVYKKFYEMDNQGGVLPESIIYNLAYNQNGKEEIKLLFNTKEGRDILFENPKPKNLIGYLIKTIIQENDIILDFFAGSGTTADSVMQLNAEDGGTRKFIMVQLDETIDKKKSKVAYDFCKDNGFKPVISSICIERINRAGEKITKELAKKQDLFSNNKKVDIGYKVFSLKAKPKVTQQIFKINNKRNTTLDTLVNMLCATCKTLDTRIKEIIKDKVYQADSEVYVLANIETNDLEKIANVENLKINLDGWANIDLEAFLNLKESFKENLTVIY